MTPVKRLAIALCGLVVLLYVSSVAFGAGTAKTRTASGTITAIDGDQFTIQTPGPQVGLINAMIRTANAITKDDYPYVWGGGHGEAGVASVGIKGPGYTGHTKGFDCSGSVAAVLAGAGLWPAGSGVPADNGVIAQLMSEHLIARGAGTGPNSVTLYDDPGVHIFMNIDGRFFGTSDGGGGGDRKGGAGWLSGSAWDASDRAFKQYHVLPAVLDTKTTYGQSYTFQLGAGESSSYGRGGYGMPGGDENLLTGFALGDKVKVSYAEAGSGEMTADAIAWFGATTTTGTVTSIATDGSTVTIKTSSGRTYTFSLTSDPSLLNSLQEGDTVQIVATKIAGVLTAHGITITATPAPATTTPTTTTPTTTTPTTTTPTTTTPTGDTGSGGDGSPGGYGNGGYGGGGDGGGPWGGN
jgi:hypothetical protein